MTNLKKNEKILLVVLLVAVIGYIYFQFLLSPTLSKINDEQANIDSYNSELKQLKAMNTANKKLEATLNDLKGTSADDSEAIPSSSKTPQIQRDLKTMADGTRVTLSSITFGNIAESLQDQTQPPAAGTAGNKANTTPSSSGNGNNSNTAAGSSGKGNAAAASTASSRTIMLPATISISGDYDGVKSFVKALEDSKRISAVSDFNIIPKTDKGSDGQVTATIIADFFYFEDGKSETVNYDFNNGQYGKPEPFK